MKQQKEESEKLVCSFDPTTRGLAYVVMEGPAKILDWGVAEARFSKNRRCLDYAKELIEFYEPQAVIMEDPKGSGCRRYPRTARLLASLADQSRKLGVTAYLYPRDDVKELFRRFGAHTKYEIAKAISEWLPELAPSLPRKRKPWMSEDLRMSVFDAISFALTFYYFED